MEKVLFYSGVFIFLMGVVAIGGVTMYEESNDVTTFPTTGVDDDGTKYDAYVVMTKDCITQHRVSGTFKDGSTYIRTCDKK
ncbi:hypothetical protein CEW46_21485 [Bacillus cereus]|nr:hypothetical protein CEW46_21485 [Bacillus cereus]